MSMPLFEAITIPAVLSGASNQVDLCGLFDKGYTYVRDAGAGFTGVLEGSVAGLNWTTIVALAASGQGAIPAQYNFCRVTVSVAGALGATTALMLAGKD